MKCTFSNLIDEMPFRDKMPFLIKNLNRQQITMTNNHLKMNFYKRLSKYLGLRTGETRKNIIYKWCKDIYNETYTGNNPFILSIKKWLKYVPTDSNIMKYSSHFIKIYYKILKEFEKYENTKGIRLFNLLPNKHSFTIDNIEICSSCLDDIISYLTKKPTLKDFIERKREHWCRLFNIEKYETINKKFHYIIHTDGTSAVITMERPKVKEVQTKDIKNIEYEQYVGIDPGIRSLFTSCNEEEEGLQYSTRKYRHDSKMIYASNKREAWYKNWDYYENWKNIPTFKSSSTVIMMKYLEYVLPNLNKYFKFHTDKNFRGLKFTTYCRSKAVLTKICQEITNNKKTLVGFGDYSQQHGLVKGHPTTPILKLKRELKRHCDVVDIDEWGTSKTCHKCLGKVELYRNKKLYKGKARMSNYHGVIRCSSNECKLCCMDRDINASKNILLLLLYEKQGIERPKCFSPEKKE